MMELPDLEPGSLLAGILIGIGVTIGAWLFCCLLFDNDRPKHTRDEDLYRGLDAEYYGD